MPASTYSHRDESALGWEGSPASWLDISVLLACVQVRLRLCPMLGQCTGVKREPAADGQHTVMEHSHVWTNLGYVSSTLPRDVRLARPVLSRGGGAEEGRIGDGAGAALVLQRAGGRAGGCASPTHG